MSELDAPSFRFIAAKRRWIPSSGEPRPGEVTRLRLLGGREIDCVANDGEEPPEELLSQPFIDDVRKAIGRINSDDRKGVIGSLLAAGVAANRWTCPDLVQQLSTLGDAKIKAVLCSAIDLDPALPVQDTLLAEHGMEVAAGVAGLARLVGATIRVIALPEDSRSQVVAAMKSAAGAMGIRLDPLLVEYPLAYPSIVARRSLGVRLGPDTSPTRAGVIFLDAPAALAIGRFFLHAARVTRIPVGVYDRRFNRSHLAWIPPGMRLGDLLTAFDLSVRSTDLFTGHMLLDRAAQPSDIFTAESEYAVFASDHHAPVNPDPCVRCGWCAEACPAEIHPAGLLEAAQQQDMALADRFGVRSCIECGICTHVCPSRLPLLHAIRGMRRQTVPTRQTVR
jgi:electron transport complex protein RnfC